MQKDSTKTKAVRVVTLILLLGVILGGLALAWPVYCKSRSLKAKAAEIDVQIAERNAEIADLKDKQRRFRNDPDFVESIARQNRRVYPGELVFVFGDRK